MEKTIKNKTIKTHNNFNEKPNYITTNQIFEKIYELSRDNKILDKILKHNVSEIDRFINNQAKLKRRFFNKFREFYENKFIIYPPRVNCEQSSSDATAKYKVIVISELIRKSKEFENQNNNQELTLLDATCGFGIDTLNFAKATYGANNFNGNVNSKIFHKVIGIDKNFDIININEHNRKQLKIDNLQFFNLDFEEYLNKNKNEHFSIIFDIIYIDPSRRNENGNKVFLLSDLKPDIIKLMDKIKSKTDFLFVKLSPLIDIQYLIKTFENIMSIHLVEYENELKEVLILLNLKQNIKTTSNFTSINIHLAQIKENENTIENIQDCIVENRFVISSSTNFNLSNIKYSEPLDLIYEPSISEMKLGYWDLFQSFNKIAPNTHYFTLTNETYHLQLSENSNHFKSFLGKFYRIIKTTNLDKKELEVLNIQKANIKIRNAKISVEEAYKSLKIKNGGEYYIFIFNDFNSKLKMVITQKI